MEVRALLAQDHLGFSLCQSCLIGTDLCFVVCGLKGSEAGLASPLLHSLGYVALGCICWIELSPSSEVLQDQHTGGPERANNEGRFSPIDPCLPVKPLGHGPGRG